MEFVINRLKWRVRWVRSGDNRLYRSDGTQTVGVTDMETQEVYLLDRLQGDFLRRVIAHELCHCFMFAYNISIPLEQEEFLADWVSVYGTDLIYLLDDIMAQIASRAA